MKRLPCLKIYRYPDGGERVVSLRAPKLQNGDSTYFDKYLPNRPGGALAPPYSATGTTGYRTPGDCLPRVLAYITDVAHHRCGWS